MGGFNSDVSPLFIVDPVNAETAPPSMIRRTLALVLGLIFLPSGAVPLHAQPADSLLQGALWKTQGQAILSAWTQHARAGNGTFYTELDRTWTPADSSTQYPGMLARHLYSYTAGYLMTGRETYLTETESILEFLIEHGWDETHGGWYNAVTRTGEVVDADKDLFMQIYATTGLALYHIATRDDRAATYLKRSRRFMQNHAWDEEHGGYVDALNRDGSVKASVKDFSPQLAPLSGYLLYLYPATQDQTYLQKAEKIMNLTLTHMQDDRGWILERFSRDWTFLPDDAKNSHINVGHNLEVAWLLLRLHALTGTEKYRRHGLALADKLLKHAFHEETGAWLHKLKRTDPSQHPNTAVWWVQAYGNMLQLYAYRTTNDERYLDAFRKGAQFWNEAFVDDKYGGTVLRTTLDGAVVDGDKAVRTKTSYHAVEHALLNYLYLDLWANDTPVTLHYLLDTSEVETVRPLPIEDVPRIERVLVNGTEQMPPDTAAGTVHLPSSPSGPMRLDIDMTSAPPSQ